MAARHQRAARESHPARGAQDRPAVRGDLGHRGRAERRLRLSLFRVFPYDADAAPGEPYSPQHVPPQQGSGRFDLPERPVWYLSESPVHAVCEVLQMFRSRNFRAAMLRRFEYPLALIEVSLPPRAAEAIVDLDAPSELVRLQLTPGELASESRSRTQTVARRVYASGAAGMRWWSKLNGDWHGVVLFLDRVPVETLEIGTPEPLTPDHAAVASACEFLAITGARRG